MTTNIDNLFFFNTVYIMFNNLLLTNTLFQTYSADILNYFQLLKNIYWSSLFGNMHRNYLIFYLDCYYTFLINNNLGYFLFSIANETTNYTYSYYFFFFFKKIFKINLFLFIIYTIYFVTNFENYIKQQQYSNTLAKLFILNVSEKEVGPVDDYFFFAILFILTISLFIFTSILLIVIQNKIFIWAIGGLFLLMFLILTIPVSLFIDFGIVFCVTIRGSASSNNFIKELLFDIISTTTVFIRFVIQNIRFFFIFSAIFELLEWVFATNNALFLSTIYTDNNIFVTNTLNNNFYYIKNFNYLLINTILFVILYFYYLLHLLFLLLVQVTIYLGISIWLFFFLYSTKFLTKYEKYFIFKTLK